MKYKISVELWDGTKLEKLVSKSQSEKAEQDIQKDGFYQECDWALSSGEGKVVEYFRRKVAFYPTTAIKRVDIDALPPE